MPNEQDPVFGLGLFGCGANQNEPPVNASVPQPKPKHEPLHLRGGNPQNPLTASSITFAALNVKGANSAVNQDKWKTIIRNMLSKKIAVLCVLESHSYEEQINK